MGETAVALRSGRVEKLGLSPCNVIAVLAIRAFLLSESSGPLNSEARPACRWGIRCSLLLRSERSRPKIESKRRSTARPQSGFIFTFVRITRASPSTSDPPHHRLCSQLTSLDPPVWLALALVYLINTPVAPFQAEALGRPSWVVQSAESYNTTSCTAPERTHAHSCHL